MTPTHSSKGLDNIDFADVSNSVSSDISAFNKIQTVSKLPSTSTAVDLGSFNSLFRRVNNLYISTSNTNNNSHFYGINRQYNLASKDSTLSDNSTLLDKKGLLKFFTDTLDVTAKKSNDNLLKANSNNFHLMNTLSPETNEVILGENLNNDNNLGTVGNLTEKKVIKNTLKFTDSSKKKLSKDTRHNLYIDELLLNNRNINYSWNLFNESINYRFNDLNSSNLKFIGQEKNGRSLGNSTLKEVCQNLNHTNNLPSLSSNSLNLFSSYTHSIFN